MKEVKALAVMTRPELEQALADVNVTRRDMHKLIALQQARIEALESALRGIADSPHRAYDGNAPYISEHSSGYALGVADGHRCAANSARAALAATEPRP